MAVYLFKSTDADAPRLSGTAGDLTNLLQKCLVDGYNALTGVTVTRSGSTATFTKTAHGFVTGQRVRHSGFTETEYNVDARITVLSSSTWSITVSGTPTTPGATSGSAKMCPLDWTAAYTGTNKTAFRQKTTGMNGFYLRVDDSNAQNSQVRGYETMSDVDTGTGAFPTNAQVTVGSGLYFYKSNAASTANRPWYLYSGNGKLFVLVSCNTGTTFPGSISSAGSGIIFGDLVTGGGSDNYATIIVADLSTNIGSNSFRLGNVAATTGALSGHYFARTYAGTGTAVTGSKYASNHGELGFTALGTGGNTYPHPIYGGLLLGKMHAAETGAGGRGVIPGLWTTGHVGSSFTHGDTFSGATGSTVSGKTFEWVYVSSSSTWGCVFETSDTVDSSFG